MELSDFFDAVIDNDAQKVEDFLKRGMDPNATLDRHALTPLHFAVMHDSAAAAMVLIRYGANINAEDVDGMTPHDWALQRHPQNMATLLEYYREKLSSRTGVT